MATIVEVELQAKTDKAISELEELRAEVKKLNEQVSEGNKNTAEGLKDVSKASSATAKGVKKIGTAMKAAGIGLLVAVFAKLKEVFEQNQKVMDFFNIAFESLSLAFNDFFNFLDNNVGSVIDWFKAIFDDPVQSIKNLGKVIWDNIVERFNSALDALGYFGSALSKVFKGDFAGALNDVKKAGKELVDVATGVPDSFDKIADGVSKAVDAITDYVESNVKAAISIVDLRKEAELAQIVNQGLIEKYDLLAEKQRQIRDDETKSVADRIKANEELGRILEEQQKAMLANAQAAVRLAELDFQKNDNLENTKALLEAKNELDAINAQITGFQSEQLVNQIALRKELLELTTSQQDAEFDRNLALAEFNAEQIDNEVLKLQRLKDIAEEEKKLREQQLLDRIFQSEAGTQAEADAKIAYDDFIAESEMKNLQLTKDIEQAKRDQHVQTFENLVAIAGEETKLGKALFLAKQAIALKELIMKAKQTITFANLNAAESTSALATGTAETAKIGFPQNIPMLIGYAAQAAGIISAIKSAKDKAKEAAGGSGGSLSSVGSAPNIKSTPPAFNVVGNSGVSQLADVISSQNKQPMKAYVVGKEVTTQQALDREIEGNAKL